MTIYLKFPDAQTAETEMVAAGYQLSEYKDHFQASESAQGWGTLFGIAGSVSHFANVYDSDAVPVSLDAYVVPEPLTPNNIRAGDDLQTVFRTVVVTAAIRDTARALVVAMAGDVNAGMWSQGLSASGAAPATHYINSGQVRVELAALLANPQLLADAIHQDLQAAQYILGQCDVSAEDPLAVMARLGLVAV